MAGRRRKGEGGIYERKPGQWCAQVDFGTDENGHRRRKSLYGPTSADVAKQIREIKTSIDRGEYRPHAERTALDAFIEKWLVEVKQPLVTPGTFINLEATFRLHVKPYIIGLDLGKLTAQQMQSVLVKARSKNASDRMMKKVYLLLRSSLEYAVRIDVINRNPMLAIDAPRYSAKEFTALNSDEVKRLFAAAKGDQYEHFYTLAVFTGMRLNEILALRWVDVDFGSSTLSVRHSLKSESNKIVLRALKTKSSRRSISLSPQAALALQAQRTAQEAEKVKTPWVFPNPNGGPIDGRWLRRRPWTALLKRAQLEYFRIHDLRHTFATLLLRAETHPKIVMEALGHSRISTTIDLYSHALPHMQREAIDKLGDILK